MSRTALFYHSIKPSPVARRLLWHVFQIGQRALTQPAEFRPREKPGAGLLAVVSGRGELRLESGTFALQPGPDLWLYSTQRERTFVPARGERLVTRPIWFGGPGLEAWLDALRVDRQPAFQLARPKVYHEVHRTLVQLVTRRPEEWEWQVHSVLSEVLRELLRARRLLSGANESLPEPVVRVLNAVESDRHRDWKAKELAAFAGVSYSALRQLFREALHESLHDHLQQVRVDAARQLLADDSLRVKEVAQRLHFSTEYYFTNFFRNQTGVSPTEFRNLTAQKKAA